jgi:hypothetical protein
VLNFAPVSCTTAWLCRSRGRTAQPLAHPPCWRTATLKPMILYFGCYEPLAEARKLLIERAGCEVICSINMAETLRLIANETIALVVVCSSCDDDIYDRFTNSLRVCSLSVPILRLDESYSAVCRDPEILSLLVCAALPQDHILRPRKKPPQSAQAFPVRKIKT